MITKPKGTYDLINENAKLYEYISEVAKNYMINYNYEYIRTPIFEDSALFHRSVGESSDIVTKETYDFKDRGDRLVTLRPEGTAGIVRSFIENKLFGNRNDAIKLYYNGTMYRYERPQSGRYREFMQIGAEAFNSNSVYMDAEVISLGFNILKELGLENITIAINTLGDKESRANYTKALVDYLKPHINDLCEDCQARLQKNPLRILDCKVDKDSEILKNVPKISDYLTSESKERFNKLKELLIMLDVDFEIRPNLVRGLDYYDECVWEYLNEDDLALGGGGRYNSLVKSLDGPDIPAVGFALGIDRVMEELKKVLSAKELEKKIDVYIMSISEEENIHALNLAQNLRLNNIRAEINTTNMSLKSQFKVADNNNAAFIIMLNDEDLQKGLVTVKDNVTKEDTLLDEHDVVDYILSNI